METAQSSDKKPPKLNLDIKDTVLCHNISTYYKT